LCSAIWAIRRSEGVPGCSSFDDNLLPRILDNSLWTYHSKILYGILGRGLGHSALQKTLIITMCYYGYRYRRKKRYKGNRYPSGS
jgi:hypothetical protein